MTQIRFWNGGVLDGVERKVEVRRSAQTPATSRVAIYSAARNQVQYMHLMHLMQFDAVDAVNALDALILLIIVYFR